MYDIKIILNNIDNFFNVYPDVRKKIICMVK